MALTEKHIRNIFIYALPRFAGYGLNILILPILTRILTPEDFGIITLALAFPAIAVSIMTFGLSAAVPRYYFEYRHDEGKLHALIFSTQMMLFLFLFLSSTAVFMLKEHISDLMIGGEQYGMAIFIAYVSAYVGYIINFYLLLYQNMEEAGTYAAFSIAQAIATSGFSLIFVWHFKMSYMGVIYGQLLSGIIICAATTMLFNRNVCAVFNGSILFENVKYGLQVVPKSLTGFINRYFDKYMLNNMLSLSAVGIYNIGQTVGNTTFILMNTVWSSFQPVCYKDVFDKGSEASVSTGRLFTIFSYIALTPLLLLILFAEEIMHIIAPPSYSGAVDIIVIILGGIATQVFGIFVGVQYAYSKKAYWIFPISALGTAANVLANIVLIPRYGLVGAGVATVVTYLLINGALTIIGQKMYRVQYEWKTLAALMASIAGAIIAVLYCRAMGIDIVYVYMMKLGFIAAFTVVGIWSRLITLRSINKLLSAVFRQQKTG